MAHRVITAIGIEVQPLRAPGIKICAVIRRDKPAQLRVVIPRVQVIESGVVVVIIAPVTERVAARSLVIRGTLEKAKAGA